ncbi:alginate O-acetyltransferase AlgX-related protein [Butyrivibrio fibrisolvens]|uniref:alginate O-acetyltransferase AlgX-related protein n=1 Tax=Butyrivibrio fibrisolvens TaxID=831 RepID=UPI0004130DC1|nr:hypothetical protein [Butyrivibrio fibrisolvens]
MKRRKKIFVIIIYFLLCGVYISYLFIGKYLDRKNHENHVLVTIDDVIEANFIDKFATIENFNNDHLPYKNELSKINGLIDLYVFRNMESDSVVLGRDNWLFYKKDLCIEDYRGVVTLSEEEINRTIDAFTALKRYCDNNGIEIYVLVTPNKETIYGDYYLPKYIKKDNNYSRADTLCDVIEKNVGIRVVFPKDKLDSYVDKGFQTYKKYDTHWNSIGGYIGTCELMAEMGCQIEPLEEKIIINEKQISGDLANMVSLSSVLCDDKSFSISDYEEEKTYKILEERPEQNLDFFHVKSLAPQVDKKIVCIGDSFLEMMIPYIGTEFSESFFLHRANYQSGTIETIAPDIIVIDATERSFPYIFYDVENIVKLLGY